MLGIWVEYVKHMPLRTSHPRKWAPMLLTVVGSLALAAGVFVAVITVTRTPVNHRGIGLPMHGAVYVGADTCFTCHGDQPPDWSLMLGSEPVTRPVAHPQTGLVDVSARAQIPQVGGAAASSVDVLGSTRDEVSQHYVIATENEPAHPAVSSADGSARCTDCHAEAHAAGALNLKPAEDACMACHTVVSRTSRDGLPARAQYG